MYEPGNGHPAAARRYRPTSNSGGGTATWPNQPHDRADAADRGAAYPGATGEGGGRERRGVRIPTTVHYEYSDSGTWDTGVNQPATFPTIDDALSSAQLHLNRGTSNCRTRVRLVDTANQRERVLSNYGYADSGWRAQ